MIEQFQVLQRILEGDVATMTALRTTLANARLRLFKAGFAPNYDTTLANLAANECDYTGYAALTLTWSAVGIGGDGLPQIISNRSFFQATDAVTPNTVGGWFLDTGGMGPVGLGYGVMDPTVPMTVALAFLAMVVNISADGKVTASVET